MPLTPFHFGPGVLVKSASRKNFSLATFVGVQVFVDIETLRNILSEQERLHTFFHSYFGSTIAAIFVGIVFFGYYEIKKKFTSMKSSAPSISAVLFSALFGGWSHVFLDSIMHSDLQPWWPWSEKNQMLQIISLEWLHVICITTALAGGILWRCRTQE